MTEFDRITEGDREKELLAGIRQGLVTPENLEDHSLPFFVKIQIQTTSLCNGRCVTCPYPVTSKKLPQGRMTEETFTSIVSQLKGRGVERTSLFLMNEPLLDKRLERFTSLLKEEVPDTDALVFTNGLLLTGERARSLAEAGMDEIDISVNGFNREAYHQVMKGIDYDEVMKNLHEVGRLHQEGALGRMRIKVVGLRLPGTEEGEDRFRRETGLEVYMKPVTNRAGLIDTQPLGGEEKGDEITACQRPFVKTYVLYNGDMVLCNCDWMRSTVIGNMDDSSLEELWMSPRLMEVRKAHLRGDFKKPLPCAECDYPYLI